MLVAVTTAQAQGTLDEMYRAFHHPPMNCRPHTRWWWMGNALSKEDITWQLEQMRTHGIGGVEQITMQPVYEGGNHPYLSPEYFDLLAHMVREAKQRHMEVSLNFGGPGWIWGGDWVPKEDRCKNLLASSVDIEGGRRFQGEMPTDAALNPNDVPRSRPKIDPGDQLLAVVAGKIVDGRLVRSSLLSLTARTLGRRLTWDVPEGRWRLMAFWLVDCSQAPVVDHLSKRAMEFYCNYLGSKYRAAVGDEFGKTIESLFMDSFEVPIFRNGIYWNADLLSEFKRRKGYDMEPLLPALWWEVDDISPKIRFDVNEFLNQVGLDAFFTTFLGWCHRNGLEGRIQPYGFVTDILQGAGMTDIPEMEITPGEKDAVPWFDMRVGPRTYVPSGAHLYGRNTASVEAYTYEHWEPGRSTLEELKISSDMFLRSGANKFYNSGFTGTPERDFVPSRRFDAEITISPVNTWWRYYPLLADYVARCSAALRFGHPVADIAVYSPLANQWTLDVLNARRWTRDFDWGDLSRLLLSNGYDFDLINDNVLLNHSDLSAGTIQVRNLTYQILVLPNIHALPVTSMKRVQEFARNGGVVIALEQTPGASTGLADYQQNDAQVRAITSEMFREPVGMNGTGEHPYGRGQTYFMKKVMYRTDPLDLRSSVFDPFVNTLRRHVSPDMSIDFVREGLRENNGLVYVHRQLPDAEIYFVANVQDRPLDMPVGFRVSGMTPRVWNPYDGEVKPLFEYHEQGGRTVARVRLAPYESTILVFTPQERAHVSSSNFAKVLAVDSQGFVALAALNGRHRIVPEGAGTHSAQSVVVDSLPAPYEIAGDWRMTLEGPGFPRTERTLARLASWTDDPATKNFSGTGTYTIAFDLPSAYVAPDLLLQLSAGDVGNVADVELNGHRVGIIWMRGQTLDVTSAAQAGRNEMTVQVTNTLINRVAGWTNSPPLPANLQALYGRGVADDTPQGRRLFGFSPLPRSGLLGPVVITPFKLVRVPW
jgi:hypothetical protein